MADPILFNPYDWYWIADDLRLFSSARSVVVPQDDPEYVAWLETGASPTPWPRDDEGNQTVAELQRVLFPYLIHVDLKAYGFSIRDQKEHGGMTVTGVPPLTGVRTDDYTQSLIARYHTAAAQDAGFTATWVLPDRSTVTLNAQAINDLWTQSLNFVTSTYVTYSTVIAGIDAGTITSTDQIDAAFGTTLRKSKPVDIGWQS